MPIEIGLWKLGAKLEPVRFEPLETERKLEDALATDLSLVGPGLLLIKRQVTTTSGKFVDMLAVDVQGTLVVIELKRSKTPREAVAQLLDYASWAKNLSRQEISDLYSEAHVGASFDEAYVARFGSSVPEEINEQHKLVLVCASLDPESERIIEYLSSDYGVPINAVFFRFFRDGASEFLARSWLIEPNEVEARSSRAITQKTSEPWNGRDFVVNFGDGDHRSWVDGQKYGFVAGGGGRWYSSSLRQLFKGARVFVNIPQEGFVGVGTVTSEAVPAKEFRIVMPDGTEQSLLNAPLRAPEIGHDQDDPELAEYVVGVDWIHTRPREQAYRETGMQGNQNTAWKLRDKFTLEKLKAHFNLQD
ncbi:MAG: DUF91 domain-containing protein [Chthoniobacterales bacterium]|nr:DUF91 domain-containing protein [Chthoniobacterales bacterium]